MIYLRWIKKRFVFFTRIVITFFDRVLDQKKSQFVLHKTHAHRCPYQAVLFYTLLGRVIFTLKEVIALLSQDKIFKKSITIDGFDKEVNYKKLYEQGNNNLLYPKSPMVNTQKTVIEDGFYKKISAFINYSWTYT